MMTEGTYPYGFGGVSVWCDQLIRGMPGHDFSLVAIVATEAERMVWSLPGNVAAVDRVPLWGPAPASPAVGRRNGLPGELLRELIDWGAISPRAAGDERWVFTGATVTAVRTACRLGSDLELEPQGMALALTLLERIRRLEAELADLRARRAP